jgi:hypothetical protein
MSTFPSPSALSAREHDRLRRLVAGLPAAELWSVRHMHGALLCVLGLLDPPDAAYARAAARRFTDVELTRRRALGLLEQLDRDVRAARDERRHGGSGREAA